MTPPRRRDREAVDVHLHFHLPPEVLGILGSLTHKIDAVARHQEQLMSIATDIQDRVSEIEADAAAESEVVAGVAVVVQGAVDLLGTLSTQIAELRAEVATGLGGPEIVARLDALNAQGDATRDALTAAKDSLAAAVVAGTSSETP